MTPCAGMEFALYSGDGRGFASLLTIVKGITMSRVYSCSDPITFAANVQVVKNIRQQAQTNKKLEVLNNYSDQEIFAAWDFWSESEDYPNIEKIIDYLE